MANIQICAFSYARYCYKYVVRKMFNIIDKNCSIIDDLQLLFDKK